MSVWPADPGLDPCEGTAQWASWQSLQRAVEDRGGFSGLSWPKIVEDANQKAKRAMDRRRFSRQDNVLQKGPFEEEEG